MTSRTKRISLTAATLLGLAAGGAAIAVAGGAGDDNETPITGAALGKASAVALQHTGGGRVTATEAGDEEGAYEVEVTRADGSRVDVHLDSAFNVIGSKVDRDETGGNSETGDQDGSGN